MRGSQGIQKTFLFSTLAFLLWYLLSICYFPRKLVSSKVTVLPKEIKATAILHGNSRKPIKAKKHHTGYFGSESDSQSISSRRLTLSHRVLENSVSIFHPYPSLSHFKTLDRKRFWKRKTDVAFTLGATLEAVKRAAQSPTASHEKPYFPKGRVLSFANAGRSNYHENFHAQDIGRLRQKSLHENDLIGSNLAPMTQEKREKNPKILKETDVEDPKKETSPKNINKLPLENNYETSPKPMETQQTLSKLHEIHQNLLGKGTLSGTGPHSEAGSESETAISRYILLPENRDTWKGFKAQLPKLDEQVQKLKITERNKHLIPWFELFKFLIERADSRISIWWDRPKWENLLAQLGPQDVVTTLKVGDLMRLDLEEKLFFLKEEKSKIASSFIKIMKDSHQDSKLYEERWGNGLGKSWLSTQFQERQDDTTRYQRFIEYISSVNDIWNKNKVEALTTHDLNTTKWVPCSLKIIWYNLGFSPKIMAEFLNILEAYRTRKANIPYAEAVAKATVQEKGKTIPPAFADENMPERLIKLSSFLSSNPAEKTQVMSWVAQNTYTPSQLRASMLNAGKYNSVSIWNRMQFSLWIYINATFEKIYQGLINLLRKLRLQRG
ncbi:hypothetical protein O181_002727 [Austropuccinia psidii MF-1]|uniref:Uncharacterized protein n=1 Tax=Austropuccinia psidii MF-1 TaxID=1389203 RepID=A0A9Q3BD14_9BASI|nr:hypothetical protein [Austropuccinia psidii MF-1]